MLNNRMANLHHILLICTFAEKKIASFDMKSVIKNIKHSMAGVFSPKSYDKKNDIIAPVYESIKELEFYGSSCDKKALRGDVKRLYSDVRSSYEKSHVEFHISR